jgi:membrane peptidoglycan carboxypeptidase
LTLVGVAYANTPVPSDAQSAATKQQSVLYYSDGKTVLARVGTARINVDLATGPNAAKGQVPQQIQNAVIDLEDHNFWHEPGVSPTGTLRAVASTVTGGQEQGGSTITQQMARNYYTGLSQQRSLTRKFKEILISVRLGQQKSKAYILKTYLNTVNMGRGTYGIGAAAYAYFRKDVSQLTVPEGCVLAAMIQRPTYFHNTPNPNDPAYLAFKSRWDTCLNDMVKYNTLSPSDRATEQYPKIASEWTDSLSDPQGGYLEQRALKELQDTWGIADIVKGGGYRIVTTFNKQMQDQTASTITQLKKDKNLNFNNKKDGAIHFATATIDPKTGEVWAAYGGPDYKKQFTDDAWYGATLQPGSSMKPYVLATALSQGINLKSEINGDTPQTIAGASIKNDSPDEKGTFDLISATAQSINTAYVWLGQKVGLDQVITTATKAGIKPTVPNFKPANRDLSSKIVTLPLGTNVLSPVEQAAGYATFANMGKHMPTHVIKEVDGPDLSLGKPFAKKLPMPSSLTKSTTAFSSDVARDATYAMQQVITKGTGSKAALPDGRDVAGKTGTTSQNRSAWFVGFTPNLSTSVAMFREKTLPDGGTQLLSLQNLPGYSQVYGGQIPAELFSQLMSKYLNMANLPATSFQPPVYGGQQEIWSSPTPSGGPSVSNTPSHTCKPGNGGGTGKCGNQSTGNSKSPSNTPCTRVGYPQGCNPNLDPGPGFPYHQTWCKNHPGSPNCLPTGGPTGPGNGNGNGNGTGNGNGDNSNTNGQNNAQVNDYGLVREPD